ncbi:hypothetical protein EDC01DRAFT_637018 [Geopyxis carbonaria]|nr:hypothetical protein EDC01DRAFT_637018 [Geopyxis carbonaria]
MAYNPMQSGLLLVDVTDIRTIRSPDFQKLEPDSSTVAHNTTQLYFRHNPMDNHPQFIIKPITLIISHLIKTIVPQFKITISAKSSYPDFMGKIRAQFELANDDFILVYAPVNRSQELLDEEKLPQFADRFTPLLLLRTKTHAICVCHAHRTEFFSRGRVSAYKEPTSSMLKGKMQENYPYLPRRSFTKSDMPLVKKQGRLQKKTTELSYSKNNQAIRKSNRDTTI